MISELPLVSGAFFGLRHDRDSYSYYSKLLANLAEQSGQRLTVFTNEPDRLDPGLNCLHVPSLEPYVRSVWDVDDWKLRYHKALERHKRNLTSAQYLYPDLPAMYLAKVPLMCEAAKTHGACLWIDAGLLFSTHFDHKVPNHDVGYHAESLRDRFFPAAQNLADLSHVFVSHFTRKYKLFRNNVPRFHGSSHRDMDAYATKLGLVPDMTYVAAGVFYVHASAADSLLNEFRDAWRVLIDMGGIGTEENVLSALRWRHGWPGLGVNEWVEQMVDPRILASSRG